MNEIINLIPSLSDLNIITFFFKAFAVLFAFIYLVFAIAVTRQTQVMLKTVTNNHSRLLMIISSLQIIFAVILIFFSITII
ncbi:hypothetical protein A3F03_01600 [Candidatus Roizmanbacteria bacterium RIFCSPHIGHO2_12_FULL_41_11]|uniref:Uncharacterized protein n=2 Tax=Candidatus Roizmaniibacteriota TaxID=1752723 RepID=A0A1F7JR36_9BACT|nr:MAG: hypothetical protein A3F03_01600 [Candidatus Roizmanbacteria bacterium RIFCSPHIGHO2_12_FULL_41_11]OGK58080.1 MAG: hypothetical protein A3H86_02680 [Candidatus Roizmanbacteria bacterium RIFCSPLOWO2_02_FULL_41_9]